MRMKTLIISAFLLISLNLFSQINGNLLKVEGESILSETPEEMCVGIPVNSKDSIYSKCYDKLIEKYNFLILELTKNGISKEIIRTNRLNIEESYNWNEKERKSDGYVGLLEVSITLKYTPENLNKILKSLNNNSYNILYAISFQLSQEQRNILLEKAIQEAITDAKNKAKTIAESLNLKLVEIKEINFGFNSDINDPLVNRKQIRYVAACVADNQNLQLNPEKLEIQKSIGIIWRIEK